MSKHIKKMIAPIVVTIICVTYLIIYLTLILCVEVPFWISIPLGIGLFALIGVCIFVLFERINEIRSGEEDDLSKY